MSQSLSVATTPLATMVENQIAEYDLPISFEGEWDAMATNPLMVVRLPATSQFIAQYLHKIRQTVDERDDVRELKWVILQTGAGWDVSCNKWSLTVQIPDDESHDFDIGELHNLLLSKV